MTLPIFIPGDDPGPDFVGLLDRLGVGAFEPTVPFDAAQITHGTTVLAIRYSDGVLMAGDRRVTSG